MKTADRLIDLLLRHGEDEFSRVLEDPEKYRIELPYARPWIRAIEPYAVSSSIWRMVGLLVPYALHAQPSPVACDALKISRIVRRRRQFPRSRAELEGFHGELLDLGRSKIRSQSVNFGSQVFLLPRHGALPPLIERLLVSQNRKAKKNPIAQALVTAMALLLVHPFTDGNGRLTRASLSVLGRNAIGCHHVPLAIPFVMQLSSKLFIAQTQSVESNSLDPFTECFAKSALACAGLSREIVAQAKDYTEDCAALLADTSTRAGSLLVGSVVLSDEVFGRCMKRIPKAHRETVESQMYTAVIDKEGVKWINAKCLRKIDQLLPLMFKLI
jgi:hypothetical protein